MVRTSAFRRLSGGASARRYPGVDGWERITTVTCRIRLVLGVVAVGLTPIVPVSHRRVTWLALMAGLYLPYALVARVLGPRWQGRPLGFVIAGADISMVFLIQLLFPTVRVVGLFIYLTITLLYAAVGGLPAGLVATGFAVGLSALAEALEPSQFLDAFTIAMYGVVLVALTVILDAARREQRHARFFELSSDMLCVVGRDGFFREVNPAWEATLGWTRTELTSRPFLSFVHPDDAARTEQLVGAALVGRQSVLNFENRYQCSDGSYRWLAWRAVPSAREQVYYGVARDMSDSKAAEHKLAYAATHDSLTGLPNRTLLVDRLEQALGRAARHPSSVAVLFLDLDDFKVVNDSLGHAAGDQILSIVGQRLAAALRPGDTVARFGGDEFVVLCEDLAGPDDAIAVAGRVLATLEVPVALAERDIWLGASVGIAFAGPNRQGAEDLLRDADAAMYRAKEQGRRQVCVFGAELRDHAVARLELETELRGALERNELSLVYQPGVELETGRITAVEALLRWSHPVLGPVGPAEFVPVAERTGLIIPIGEWVLREACSQLAAWREELGLAAPLGIGVNLSSRQLTDGGFEGVVAAALAESGLEPWRLYLEVTESALMEQTALTALETLSGAGVLVGIDDFGTGYSSLNRLRQLPVRFLKIDRSFLSNAGPHRGDAALLAAVCELAHALRLPAVVEGPETAEHVALLRAAGVKFAQGFYFGRPAPADEISDLLRDRASAALALS